ncbi:TauD/TfdA family dioxygenase [Flavobacterium polysaccharolyticum]|uniref:TauD/TfdA family dioxygenase n=1 Tax=Flavobacterium polysaccharolyticum TaxID=3133148 RepID=A0ABU9NUN5_9FLAO
MITSIQKLKGIKAQKVSDSTNVEYAVWPGNGGFPLVIKPSTVGLQLNDWLAQNRSLFEEKVNQYGAILFRGFHINTVEKFEDFSKLYADTPLEYNLRSSPRYAVGKNVYHTTTYPKEYHIEMHSESSYAPSHPSNIVFCCIDPADKQGETPIADNKKVLEYLSEKTKTKFFEKGVKYVRNLNEGCGLSWTEVFQTEDKTEVEATCKEQRISYEWKSDTNLVLTWNKKAIWEHPATGDQVWFNHAYFFNKHALEASFFELVTDDHLPNNTFYGDGSEISKEEIEEIRVAYQKATVVFPWEKGDVLFLDNMLMSHGRNPYEGSRQIIASLF